MNIVSKTDLSPQQKEIICRLWNSEYPEKLAYNSISEFENYLNNLSYIAHYLLQDESEEMQGWAITFSRENEKWFAIIVNSKIQNKGFGTLLLNHLKTIESKLSGWVIDHNNDSKLNGTAYVSPLPFYLKNGFSVFNKIRIETEKISAVKIVWNS
jgi:GNAT superfamily N-acetyltransferase